MIRDRDCIYGAWVTRRLRAMGIHDKSIAPASPWQNGFVERLIGSIRRECVDQCSDASCRSSGWKTRRWNRPVATVVISGNGEGDRTVESPEVKVSVREASNPAGRNNGESVSPEIVNIGSAEPCGARRRQVRVAKELDTGSDRLPGDIGNDMLGQISQQKRGTARRSPRSLSALCSRWRGARGFLKT